MLILNFEERPKKIKRPNTKKHEKQQKKKHFQWLFYIFIKKNQESSL